MTQPELILYIIKLFFGGITAFLAILLWSRTRDAAWMSLVAGAVVSYAGTVYSMLEGLGIVYSKGPEIAGIPLNSLLFAVVPSIFFITAFVLMILRNKDR